MQTRPQQIHGGAPWLLQPGGRGALALRLAVVGFGLLMLLTLLDHVRRDSPIVAFTTVQNNDPNKFECPAGVSGSNCTPAASVRAAAGAALAWEAGAAIIVIPFLLVLWHDSRIWRARWAAEGKQRTLNRIRAVAPPRQMGARTRWQVRYHLEDSRSLDLAILAPQLAKLAAGCEQPLTIEITQDAGKLRVYAEGDHQAANQVAATLRHALPNAELVEVAPTELVSLPGERREADGRRAAGLHFYRATFTYRSPISGLLRGQAVDPAAQQQKFIKQKGHGKETERRQMLTSYLQDIEDWKARDRRLTRFQSPVATETGGSDPVAALFGQQKRAQLRVHFYGPATDAAGQLWGGMSISFACSDPYAVAALASLLGEGITFAPVPIYHSAGGSPITAAAATAEDGRLAAYLYPPVPAFYSPEPPWRWVYLPLSNGHPEIDRVPAFRLPLPDSYKLPVRQAGRRLRAAGLVYGYADGVDRSQPVGVALTNDLFRHSFVRGSTGSGKSYFLENLAQQAVELGMALVVFDPHGQMAHQLYNKLDAAAQARTEIIDLDAREASIHLNLLAVQEGDVDRAVSVAMRFFELQGLNRLNFARRYEFCQAWLSILLAAAVNRDDANFGILEFVAVLRDQTACIRILHDFEEAVAGGLRGEYRAFPADESIGTARYHADQDPKDWAENSQGVARAVSEIVGNPAFAALCRPPFTDPSAIMDQGGILLCALNEERHGSAVSNLFEVILLALQQSVMGRGVRFNEDESRYHAALIIIDEARHVVGDKSLKGAGPLVASMLKDFRKYHVSLILALQTLADISNEVYDSLADNTGMKFTFQGDADKRMAAMLGSSVDPVWIERLDGAHYQCLIKFLHNGKTLLGTIRTPATVPPMVKDLAGAPTYHASGLARVWQPIAAPAATQQLTAVMLEEGLDPATQHLA